MQTYTFIDKLQNIDKMIFLQNQQKVTKLSQFKVKLISSLFSSKIHFLFDHKKSDRLIETKIPL